MPQQTRHRYDDDMKDNIFTFSRDRIEIGTQDDFDDGVADIAYWMRRSPLERLQGIEFLRQACYCYDPVSERLPRFFEVVGQA
ncbi:MAG: hypothetical protein ACTFAL_05630 [Candidatus Electronema sp. V4]|uniref:hypothetical protein n=2 Tax=unclassified Candidatus Electronema TaxID=2677064 RepID=UPI0040556158